MTNTYTVHKRNEHLNMG